MFAKERQDKIYELVQRDGAILTSRLVKEFGVSIETIRRDLLSMEQHGQLIRVHGGAVSKCEMKPYSDLENRNREFLEQKRELSLKAAEFISEGDIICIDAGSTAISFAEVLRDKFSSMIVITHSLDVFNILHNHKDFSLILLGGHFLKGENAFYGSLTLEMLDRLHMQKAFIFPTAVSIEFGICDYNKDLYQIQKKITECSDEIFILADSSKFEKKALLKFSDMDSNYSFVTDSGLSDELKRMYEENNIKIYKGDREK